MDTSPGGDYYTSPSSPTSSSRNWTEDMEGGGAGSGGGAGLGAGLTAAGTTYSGRHCAGARVREALGLGPRGLLGIVVARVVRRWEVRTHVPGASGFRRGRGGRRLSLPRLSCPLPGAAWSPWGSRTCGVDSVALLIGSALLPGVRPTLSSGGSPLVGPEL